LHLRANLRAVSTSDYKRNQTRLIVFLAAGVIVVIGVTTLWPPSRAGGSSGAAPSAAASVASLASSAPRPAAVCTGDMCSVDEVTTQVAARLAAMPRSRLTLRDATSESLAGLRLVPMLVELDVTGTGKDRLDLVPLAGLHVLKTLTIEHASVDTLSPLSRLVVEKLVLDGVTDFPTLAPVAAMPAILDLSITSPSLSTLKDLGGGHLRSLSVKSRALTQLDGIDRIGGLEQISLDNVPLADMSILGRLDGVRNVEIGWTSLPSAVVLPPHATTVSLVSDRLKDVSFLKGYTEVSTLSLVGNQIEDLRPIASLTSLTQLTLDRNVTLKDLSPLRKLPKLESLGLSDTAVESLADVAGLPLRTIFLGNTHVRSLEPLVKMKTLEAIYFLPKNFPATEVDAVRATHPNLRVTRM
jgi:internalin A